MAARSPMGSENPADKSVDHEQEIAKYEALLAQDPRSRAFALLAEAYRKSGRQGEAIQTALDGLKYYPYYLSGRVALARAYFDDGQQELARQEFEKVISAAPDNLMAHRLLADIYLAEGKRIEAAKSLKMVILLDPRDAKAREKLASIAPPLKPAPSQVEGEFGMLLDSHRYEKTSLPNKEPAIPIMTDQEIINQPELSVSTGPPRAPVYVGIAEETPAYGNIVPTGIVDEPVFELEEETVAPPPPPPIPAAVAEPSPQAPPPSTPPAAPPAAVVKPVEPSPWDEIMEEIIPAEETPDELNTETLAEIYIQQGFYDKALAIYQKIMSGQPQNARLLQKVEELKTLVKMSGHPTWEDTAVSTATPPPPIAASQAPLVPTVEQATPRSAVTSSRDEGALKTLRQWLDRLKTERR